MLSETDIFFFTPYQKFSEVCIAIYTYRSVSADIDIVNWEYPTEKHRKNIFLLNYGFLNIGSYKCNIFTMQQLINYICMCICSMYVRAPDKVRKINFNRLYMWYFFTKFYVWPLVVKYRIWWRNRHYRKKIWTLSGALVCKVSSFTNILHMLLSA